MTFLTGFAIYFLIWWLTLFAVLPFGVRSRADALFVLGFRPGTRPDRAAIRGRMRVLAAVHHPDSPSGDHERMAQVNAAVEFLSSKL